MFVTLMLQDHSFEHTMQGSRGHGHLGRGRMLGLLLQGLGCSSEKLVGLLLHGKHQQCL